MSEADLRIFPTLEAAGRALADVLACELGEAVAARGRATLALAGGGTPRHTYEALANRHDDLPWEHIHVFLGDERFVSLHDEQSNFRMACDTLLNHVPIPVENVHGWEVEMSGPEAAATVMQAELERLFRDADGGPPRFDVMLLGIGEDGHTASLFPDSPALRVRDRWAVASEAPEQPRRRLTLTLPVLNAARHVHFLAAGEGKREALQCALGAREPMESCPASMVRPTDGTLTWWLDEEIAP